MDEQPEVRERHLGHYADYMSAPSSRPMGADLELHALRADGTSVPVEIALVPLRADAAHVAAFIRDISVRRRLHDRLVLSQRVVTDVLRGSDATGAAETAVRESCLLFDATLCGIALVDPRSGRLSLVASAGLHAAVLRGPDSASAERVVPSDTVDVVLSMDAADDVGPLLRARIAVGDRLLGALVVGRDLDAPPFTVAEEVMAVQLADTLALV